MNKRRFRMVGVGVWRSQRFRSLPNEGCRHAYLYALTNRHNTNIGLFELPPEYMASDLDVTVDEARARLEALTAVGLIHYDWDETLLMLDNWFEFNALDSRKHLAGALSALSEFPATSELTTRTLFLIASSMVERATGWSNDEKGRAAQADALTMLSHAMNDYRASVGVAAFETAYYTIGEIHRMRLHQYLRLGLPIPLRNGVSNEVSTIERETETETETETEREKKMPGAGPESDREAINKGIIHLENRRAQEAGGT
jgi:hypothetical protein